MAEINQPTPIKPAWPVRRDEPGKKRPPEAGDNQEKKKKKPPLSNPDKGRSRGDGSPHIDDYA